MVLPFIIFGFFAAIFYKGVPRDLPMAYINYDQSQLSENLLRMLDATPTTYPTTADYGFYRYPCRFSAETI